MIRHITLSLALSFIAPTTSPSQDVDSVLARVERLAVAGDRSSARSLTDSLVAALDPGSPRVADVLFWRAQTAPNAADAERDYLRIAVEHPFATRAPDALLALAQLEFARGDRTAARRRFDRVLRDYPRGKHVPRASLWSGRLAIEEREYEAGCATLNSARSLVGTEDIELGNQFDYFIAQCERARPAPPDPVATTDTGAPKDAPPAITGPQFSVQIAAYRTRRDAAALETRLKGRGFDARIVDSPTLYRVRVGRYPSRAAANAALIRMQASGLKGMVVEAERR
jgi:hypothetical protein